jgi:DNA polymerase II large subunit
VGGKMKIAVDVDDVLCETVKYFLKIAEKDGVKKKFEDFYCYNFWEVCGISKERSIELFNEISSNESAGEIELIEGAKEGLDKISRNNEIIFITSRPIGFRKHTIDFIKNRFKISSPFVLFSSDFHGGKGNKKSEFCKKEGIEIIVEDQENISLDCAENGIRVLLLDKPWNKKVNHENIIRCKDWAEVVMQIGIFEKRVLEKGNDKEEDYFLRIKGGVDKAYLTANKARILGLDPTKEVETSLALTMAEKAVNLILVVYPNLPAREISERIIELEGEHGQLDSMVSFSIAREIAEEKFCKFRDKIEAIDCGVRVGFAYMTLGVVSSPIEGYTGINLGKTKNGENYFVVNFSGPIRSAGTTATCVVLMLIDYLREHFGYARYDPDEREVARYVTENYDYHERVTNLQYLPTEEEIEFLARNIPIQISGEPSEKKEVSNFKDLERVPTNFIRGGMCLAFSEGLAQKAAKGLKRIESVKKNGMSCSGWDFLKDYLEIHKKRESGKEEVEATYIKDLVAGRPVYSGPSSSGGFRFRLGRSRASGFSAVSIHPATMGVSDDFLSIGTQLKIEKPTKGCIITSCDGIDGPIVKLKNGSVKKINSYDEAKKIRGEVEEIIYLGDMLFPLGDVIDRNSELPRCGYVEEWWGAEVEKAGGGDIDIFNVSIEDAIFYSEKFSVPLHPKFIFYWSQITKEDLSDLIIWMKSARIVEKKIILPFNEELGNAKRALEILGVGHEVIFDKVEISGDAEALALNLGFDLSEGGISIKNYDDSDEVLESVNLISRFKIKDKAGSFIGARMGRPEKAKLRKLVGSANVLFPVGEEGGRLKSIQEASLSGLVENYFPYYKCKCGNEGIYLSCEKCGEEASRENYCRECGNAGCEKCRNYLRKKIDIKSYFEDAKKHIGAEGHEILMVKGVSEAEGRERDIENLGKGILRAKYNLSVNRDGTIRYDGTEIPITHFKPKEVFVSVDKLRELGYSKDIYGEDLVSDEQVIELKVHDVILPAFEEMSDRADKVFFNIGKFIDEELVRFYKLDSFYNLKKADDLVGHLVVIMAPHNCAGVVGRIIGFSKMQGISASPFMHAAIRRDCDGDECSVMLLMDVLLNFSRKFLPGHRGGSQDAPLVLNARIRAGEVDDQILNFEVCKKYPLEVYEFCEKGAHSRNCKIETVGDRLRRGGNAFFSIGFTHQTNDINCGVLNGAYKTLPTMRDKVFGQMNLAKKIRAVDSDDVARLVIERHFLRDIRGNLRKFSRQQFRCSSCNKKFRRPPLSGVCMKCKGKIIFTISEASIKKYLGSAIELAKNFSVPDYTRESVELTKAYVESVFGKEEKQEKLD